MHRKNTAMSSEERIVELEREVIETRRAAVSLIVTLVDLLAVSEKARSKVLASLDEAAAYGAPSTSRLAKLVAEMLKRDKS